MEKGRMKYMKYSQSKKATKLRELLLGHYDFLNYFSEQLAVCFSKYVVALHAARFHILLFALPIAGHNEMLTVKKCLLCTFFLSIIFKKLFSLI